MPDTLISRSNNMTLDEVVARLAESEYVEGIALFGSAARPTDHPAADYDLLVLLSNPPEVMTQKPGDPLAAQMLTYINGLMADVAFVESHVADSLLTADKPVPPMSSEGYLIGWLENARILYDGETPPGKLVRIQRKLESDNWRQPSSPSDLYSDWFWLNFDLRHMKRMMAADDDPVYQTAVDMHLTGGLSVLCRAYCRVRNVPWRGAKAAVRYLQSHDPNYLTLFRECLAERDRGVRLVMYELLVRLTLAPVGELWPDGATAIHLRKPAETPERLADALAFWERLLGN